MKQTESFGQPSVVLEGVLLVERALVSGLEVREIFCVPSRQAWAENMVLHARSRYELMSRISGSNRAVSGMTGNPESDSGCGPAFPDPCIRIIPEKEISGIAGYSFHRGVLGYAIRPRERSVTELLPCVAKRYHEGFAAQGSLILALPEIIDPENLGASFRNAAAFGCTSLLLGPHCPDPLSRRVLRVSMGAAMSLPWARMRAPDCLDAFRRAGFTLAACVLDPDATDLRTWRRPPLLVLALGNEAFGLSPEWLAACTDRLILPMGSGTDSLNVATAGAVFLYALTCPDRERHREC